MVANGHMVSHVEATYDDRAPRKSRRKSIPIILGIAKAVDLLIVAVPAVVFYYAYVNRFGTANSALYFMSILMALLVSGAVFAHFRLHDGRLFLSDEDKLSKTISAWAVCVGLFLLIAFGLKLSDQYSRVWFAAWAGTTGIGLAVHHFTLRAIVGRWAREGLLAARTVIFGAGDHGTRLASFLLENEDFRTRIVGFADDRRTRVPSHVKGLPMLGNSADLEAMVRRDEVDEVIVALPWSAEKRVHELTHRMAMLPVQIRLASDLAGYSFRQRQFSFMAGLPMLDIFERPITGWSSIAKSIEDLVLAAVLTFMLAPALLIIAAAVKLDSRGPVLFTQIRHGFNNRPIRVFKFRTMHADRSDAHCEQQTTRADPRVTRVGQFLRRTSLDELPQLFNVLRGDMSLVGPRPHALATKAAGRLFDEIVEDYAARHKIKPGITGWAQVNGWRGGTETEEKIRRRVEHDLYYMENWSIWLDLKILLKTVLVVFKDENAY